MSHYLTRLYRHSRDLIDYLRAFNRKEHTNLAVVDSEKADFLIEAKKLHARVYVDRAFVPPSAVGKDGILTPAADPYQNHARYFAVADKKTGKVVATARQIIAKEGCGHRSFPLVTHTDLYLRARHMIATYEPSDCVEISGLAKERGASKLAPLLLYRAMWYYSLRHHHELWLLTCDVQLFVRLKLLFGPAIQRVGRTNFYLGSNVVPAIFKVQSAVSELRHSLITATPIARLLRRKVVRFLLKGLPVEALSASETRALENLKNRFSLL